MTERSRSGKTAWDKEKTRELFRRYKETGDPDAREQLVMSHMNLVRFLANKFKNRGEPLDDLMQVGYLGLLKAIDRFDPERGLEFTTFATPTILGEIKRHFRDKGWSVRVPRRLQELSAKVNQATDKLTNELQRSPKVEEIAEYLDVTVDEVLEAMESSSAYTSVPIEAPGASDSDDAPSILDRYADDDNELDFTDDRLVIEEAIRDFSPREREVIELRFVKGMTQIEIAKKLGISQVQVSRLLRRTLKKIQDKIRSRRSDGSFMSEHPQQTDRVLRDTRILTLRIWAVVGCIVIAAVIFNLMGILAPVIEFLAVGSIIAFVMSPITNWLEHHGVNRGIGSLIALIVVVAVLVGVVCILSPILFGQDHGSPEPPARTASCCGWRPQRDQSRMPRRSTTRRSRSIWTIIFRRWLPWHRSMCLRSLPSLAAVCSRSSPIRPRSCS